MIDNLDGQGALDYTPFLDAANNPQVSRKLNQPVELRFALVTSEDDFVVPAKGARVTLGRSNGSDVFAGYIAGAPEYHLLGWTERGPVFRYEIVALSDEMMLDQKTLPPTPPFVARSAGDALRRLSEDTFAGWGDLSGIAGEDVIPYYKASPAKKWSESAAEIALAARCAFRSEGEALRFSPLGEKSYQLDESSDDFSPSDLVLRSSDRGINDLTVLGEIEPSAYVRDYFVGDGFTTKFYLSQIPYTRGNRTVLDEEYARLNPALWELSDPQGAIAVRGGKLEVAGGTGRDGETLLEFAEKIELGGAVVLQHGDIEFDAASDGVAGGLYGGTVSVEGCLAGFRITTLGSNSRIQAFIQGSPAGTQLTTQPGHRYVLSTRLYANAMYRMQQVFHSSLHPAQTGRGGNSTPGDVWVVLEAHEIDPENPATQVAPATVLYDGVIRGAPGFCRYVLINAASMRCSVAFTRITLPVDALVRSTVPQEATRTRRPGSQLEGADCRVSEEPALQFFPQYAPAANELIEVSYRGRGRARARVTDPASVEAHRLGSDDGVRGGLRQVAMPAPRTSEDCEMAALAILDDAGQGWTGEYRIWSPFLPGAAADIFPGDALQVHVPSRKADFAAIVKQVEIEVHNVATETSRYRLRFVDAGDPSLGFEFQTATSQQMTAMPATDIIAVGTSYIPDLAGAAVTDVSSTTVTIDAGITPSPGEGIEVRRTDSGWGGDNDRNLVGRFSTRSFTVTRFGKAQDYFLRRYDNSAPAKYSRYSAALHVDFPL